MLIGQHWLITKLIDQQILMTKLDSSRHGFGGRRPAGHRLNIFETGPERPELEG